MISNWICQLHQMRTQTLELVNVKSNCHDVSISHDQVQGRNAPDYGAVSVNAVYWILNHDLGI